MPDMILLETEEKMEHTIDGLHKEFAKVRTGRANPKIFETVKVDYYGAPTPVSQVGNISVPEPTQMVIKPYDRSIVADVEKAINAANLGFNPQNEGTQIRIVLPALTKERRTELTKQVKKTGEEFKIHIRNVRRDANDALKKLEKDSSITEDELKAYQDDVQELTDKYTEAVDSVVQEKIDDIMSI
jgi:ribosome recycling factor